MTQIDITPYIEKSGHVNLEEMLKEHGYIKKECLLNVRIDTIALAQILQISQKTLYKYVNDGHIELDLERRITLGAALNMDFRKIQQQVKIAQPIRHTRQKRKYRG